MERKHEIELHPDESDGFFPLDAESLIIGTFPPVLNEEEKANFFYYPNPKKAFWQLVGDVYGQSLIHGSWDERVQIRMDLLRSKKIAITDIILNCVRLKENSSSDQDLCVNDCRDIKRILIEHPTIKTIYFTSGTGKNGAEQLFRRKVSKPGDKQSQSYYVPTRQKNNPIVETSIDGRKYSLITLYSPSRMTNRRGITDEIKLEQYQKYLPK